MLINLYQQYACMSDKDNHVSAHLCPIRTSINTLHWTSQVVCTNYPVPAEIHVSNSSTQHFKVHLNMTAHPLDALYFCHYVSV